MRFFTRLYRAYLNLSALSLLAFIFTAPLRKLRHVFDSRAISRVDSLQDRFTLIYSRNAWESKESVSGTGSSLGMTESIRVTLPSLFREFDVKSIFDAPCGDFNWMKLVDLQGVTYTGGDIVKPLIKSLEENFSSETISFVEIDITQSIFPESDLVLNRDCLFHFSYYDILLTLMNFIESESKYFLSTSYENMDNFKNSDIRSGGFRLIDLFASPFLFPKNFHYQIPEQGEGSLPPRKLYLWDREQVRVAHTNLGKFLSGL